MFDKSYTVERVEMAYIGGDARGNLSAEASQIGLPAGAWPEQILTPVPGLPEVFIHWHRSTSEMSHGELAGVNYIDRSSGKYLFVIND